MIQEEEMMHQLLESMQEYMVWGQWLNIQLKLNYIIPFHKIWGRI